MGKEPTGQLGGTPVRFRTTVSQWFALALVALVAVPAVVYAVFLIVGEVVDDSPVRDLVRFIAALYSMLLAVRLVARLISKGGKGVDADQVGIRPATRKATRLAAWPAITDIRVRRTPLRRRVVVYSDRGGRWWLPAPYSGLLLAWDSGFDEKVRTLREMWEANRYGPADMAAARTRDVGVEPDRASARDAGEDGGPYDPPIAWAVPPGRPGHESTHAADETRSPYAPPYVPRSESKDEPWYEPAGRSATRQALPSDTPSDTPPDASSGSTAPPDPVRAKKAGRRIPGRHRRG